MRKVRCQMCGTIREIEDDAMGLVTRYDLEPNEIVLDCDECGGPTVWEDVGQVYEEQTRMMANHVGATYETLLDVEVWEHVEMAMDNLRDDLIRCGAEVEAAERFTERLEEELKEARYLNDNRWDMEAMAQTMLEAEKSVESIKRGDHTGLKTHLEAVRDKYVITDGVEYWAGKRDEDRKDVSVLIGYDADGNAIDACFVFGPKAEPRFMGDKGFGFEGIAPEILLDGTGTGTVDETDLELIE